MSSSRYSDDAVSNSTPDYASTYSEDSRPAPRRLPEREERPRSGMLKFVGDPELKPKPAVVVGDTQYQPDRKPVEEKSDIPTIDFGPTYSLNPDGKRPGTSGTMTQNLHDSSFSHSKENLATSPGEQKRQSWLSGRTTPNATTHMRTNSASPQFSDARSVAWQPGMGVQGQSDRQKLEPDEWVAHRAATASQTAPVFNHGRSKSHTPPPLSRNQSGDWTHLQRTPEAAPARPPSRPLSRPVSRGAGHLLDQRSVQLSAREQEQVARMTGTPLIDLKHNKKEAQRPSSAGLTAYIDQREKEKAKAKTRGTTAMQAEIDRRMMVAQQRQMLEMQHMGQQQMGMAQGGYAPSVMGVAPSMMGSPSMMGAPQAFAYSSPAQMQQMYQQPQGYFPQPSPNMQQQGWVSPGPGQMQSPYFQQQQMMQQQPYMQQQPPTTQAYGASFDQAQAAARYAHQQGQQHRRG